jgi:hypothetical protein
MKTKRILLAVGLVAIALTLALASVASATGAPLPGVSGGVGFLTGIHNSFASFNAKATGPAPNGDGHQPARGSLRYSDENGLTFTVSVQHIHAHTGTEVHFGGTIVKSSDVSLLGKFAHAVAIDGGSPGTNGDAFSIIWTNSDTHAHGAPGPVTHGNLVVKTL